MTMISIILSRCVYMCRPPSAWRVIQSLFPLKIILTYILLITRHNWTKEHTWNRAFLFHCVFKHALVYFFSATRGQHDKRASVLANNGLCRHTLSRLRATLVFILCHILGCLTAISSILSLLWALFWYLSTPEVNIWLFSCLMLAMLTSKLPTLSAVWCSAVAGQ